MDHGQEEQRETTVAQFCGITNGTIEQANEYLDANDWDLAGAVAEYFTSQEEAGDQEEASAASESVPEPYTGPRTLDGRPAPTSAIPSVASSSRPTRQPQRGGIATLGSLAQDDPHAGHGHDDDDDDDEDFHNDEQPRDLFAGGEKSGLAVQDPRRNDPRKVVDDIIKKAQANTPRTGGEEPAAGPSRFRGAGMTLGGDDAPSQVIPDPNAAARNQPSARAPERRVLHLWSDGFSVEDGPLHRFDDPENAADLAVIRSGRAPIHLMNVSNDQPVDVSLEKHDEPYKQPKKVYKPFGGGGQRLGSPTPGGATQSSAPAPAAAAPAIATQSASTPNVELDSSQPTLSLRIQLANGTRLPARFNTTHTVGDIYSFISRAYPGSAEREWVLATTFPNKNHTDKEAVLGNMPEFKKGGTAVQKWL